ncbi:hypothetical protein [Anaerotruncus rubiinfantis]|uniref:hypothetical protein n=1 Tax=Anaerotruncus rubiinfantis TaxID=1720200 RepID=UPI003D7B72ED
MKMQITNANRVLGWKRQGHGLSCAQIWYYSSLSRKTATPAHLPGHEKKRLEQFSKRFLLAEACGNRTVLISVSIFSAIAKRALQAVFK